MRLPKIFQPRGKKKLGFHEEKKFLSKKGFTLIEVVIGMAIIAFLAGLGLFLSMDFYRGYSFNYEKNLIVASLQKARSRAMANINQTSHGFCKQGDEYIVFEGNDCSDLARDTSKDEIFQASKVINLTNLSSKGIVFEQLSGNAASTTLSLTGEGKTANISINEEGAIIW